MNYEHIYDSYQHIQYGAGALLATYMHTHIPNEIWHLEALTDREIMMSLDRKRR